MTARRLLLFFPIAALLSCAAIVSSDHADARPDSDEGAVFAAVVQHFLDGRDMPPGKLLVVVADPQHLADRMKIPHVLVVRRATIDAFWTDINDDGWKAFYVRFPGARGFLDLTPPEVTGDTARLNASAHYGLLGAGGWRVTLRRDGGVWRISDKRLLWES